jgi:hypothetical protein
MRRVHVYNMAVMGLGQVINVQQPYDSEYGLIASMKESENRQNADMRW